MPPRLPTICAAIALAAAPVLGQQAVEPNLPQPEKSSHPAEESFNDILFATQKRDYRIRSELAHLDRAALPADDWAKEWAGSYYTGDGLGQNHSVNIAPKGGVAYQSQGCIGPPDGANHGDIMAAFPGGVKITLALDPSLRGAFLDTTLYFVRWGDRKYVVPARRMTEIVNAYNAGKSSRFVMRNVPEQYVEQPHYINEKRPEPVGKPELPAEFAAMLIDRPAKTLDAPPAADR